MSDDFGRPAWLPPLPPRAKLLPSPSSGGRPRCTLVSVAIGDAFESKLATLRISAHMAGFDAVLLWRQEDVLSDPVMSTAFGLSTYRKSFDRLRNERFAPEAGRYTKSIRPWCAAFKMVALWRALQLSAAGDYVMWADASRYHNVSFQPGGRLAAAMDLLRGRRTRRNAPAHVAARWRESPWWKRRSRAGEWEALAVGSAYGLLTCSGWDCETDLYTWNGQMQAINEVTRAGFADLVSGDLMQRPLVLNSNLLLENTPSNRLLVWDWLGMAVARPHAFCSSHVQDQAAFTILALNRSLPLINVCPYLNLPSKRAYEPQKCVKHTKNSNAFLDLLARGAYEVVPSREVDELREGYVQIGTSLPATYSLHLSQKVTSVGRTEPK